MLGLNEVQQKVHELLVVQGGATVTELAHDAGLTEKDVTSALLGLRDAGLAETLVGGKRWGATPPEPALDALVHQHQQSLARVQAHAQQLAAQARHRSERQRPDELVAIVEGQESTTAHFEQLQRAARREVLVFDRPPYPETAGTQPNALQVERLAEGVAYRTVYDLSVLEDPGTFARVQADLSSGEQARVLEGVPLKLAIADRSMGLLPLSGGGEGSDTAVLVIRASVLLDSLVALFEALWARAVPLTLGETPAGSADPELVEVVRMLATGMSDLRMARVLGTSERTVRRKVAAAMETLGAGSRFQAGMLAQRQGWLPGD